MGITGALAVEDLLTVANSYHGPEAREPGTDDGSTSLAAHDHLDSAPAAIDFFQRHGIRLSQDAEQRIAARLPALRQYFSQPRPIWPAVREILSLRWVALRWRWLIAGIGPWSGTHRRRSLGETD